MVVVKKFWGRCHDTVRTMRELRHVIYTERLVGGRLPSAHR
jgi:hypothetical protein